MSRFYPLLEAASTSGTSGTRGTAHLLSQARVLKVAKFLLTNLRIHMHALHQVLRELRDF